MRSRVGGREGIVLAKAVKIVTFGIHYFQKKKNQKKKKKKQKKTPTLEQSTGEIWRIQSDQ